MIDPLAHGTGPGHDLPVPLFYAVAGGALAVFVSFLAMALLWPESRLRGEAAGRPLPRIQRLVDAPATRWAVRMAALAIAAAVVIAAIRLPDDPHVNPAASVVYGVLWVGLVVASLLLGPVWRLLNPLRTVHELVARVLRADPRRGPLPLPRWLGYWPAVLGLLAFVWMELVSPSPDSTVTLFWFFGTYAVVHLTAAALFGSHWFDRGDAFETYSDLIGRLAPVGRRGDGRLVLRTPLDGLDTVRPEPGLVTVACVLLATTAYDSVTVLWDYGTSAAGTAGLVASVVVVAVAYRSAAALAGAVGMRRGAAGLFAHSLIPIAAGYLIAHYIALLIGESQRAFVLLLGVDWRIDETPLAPGAVAAIQVFSIVTGHVLGVIAAHDRAVRLFEPRTAVAGQAPLMVLMVLLTVGGLTLLAAG
jgi:hypothetical protein